MPKKPAPQPQTVPSVRRNRVCPPPGTMSAMPSSSTSVGRLWFSVVAAPI